MQTFISLTAISLTIVSSLFAAEAPLPLIPATPSPTPHIAVERIPPQPDTDRSTIQVHGFLTLHKRNYVILAATERAVLMSLETEKRDVNGNILKDANGQGILVPVIEGMKVFKGQILGSFDDRELHSSRKIAKAQFEVAKAEKNKKIEVEYARRGMLVAEAEYHTMEDANKRHEGTFPDIEVLKAALEFTQAEANFALQNYMIDEVKTREVSVRESELERTDVLISLRKIVAPIDGIVVKLNQTEGEWLREGDPVLEIMQLKMLHFLGKVSAADCAVSELDGKPATVFVKLSGGRQESFSGKVVFVHPKIDAGGTYEVRIEVQNRPSGHSWQLQPGGDADAVIQLR
ncbi:MAG: HlyD family efflux transporter periplasmic adaptor subunit [Planctomycetaceae bacterium]|nr:HlyD family efflux transporter periplasmic adaptor subunit [Planctomycetaceae bacterium]